MPTLSPEHAQELLKFASDYGRCNECGQQTALDYDRTADEFYWIHRPGCRMHDPKRYGHRLTIVPFVEE